MLSESSKLRRGRMSQTFARLFNQCPHAGFLYDTHGGGRSQQMDRGTALHWIVERCIQHGEPKVPWEVAKAHISEAEQFLHVPFEERDFLSMMVYRWAEEFEIPKGYRVAACEQLFEIDVDGWVVRCKVDLALVSEDGKRLVVEDWKSSRAMPSQKEISEKRPDGTIGAKLFQLVLYALAVRYGVPVDRIACPDCKGRGDGKRHDGEWAYCPTCTGHGEVEVRQEKPLAPGVRDAEVAFVYPAIEDKFTGRMGRREATLTALEFEEYHDALKALVGRVRAASEVTEGDVAVVWPARPGSVCTECPAPMLCPVVPSLRTYRDVEGLVTAAGFVNSAAEASARAALVDRAKATVAALEQELKQWSKAHDGIAIPFSDMEFAWATVCSENLDKDGLFAALEAGEPVVRDRFVKPRVSSRWTKRKAGTNGE